MIKENPAPSGVGAGSVASLGINRADPKPAETLAQQIADQLLEERNGRKFFLNVFADKGEPDLPIEWKYKCARGHSFWYSEVELARAWIVDALHKGFWVFRTSSRRRWGLGYGRSLRQGVPDY